MSLAHIRSEQSGVRHVHGKHSTHTDTFAAFVAPATALLVIDFSAEMDLILANVACRVSLCCTFS